jgi:hypothetical protein
MHIFGGMGNEHTQTTRSKMTRLTILSKTETKERWNRYQKKLDHNYVFKLDFKNYAEKTTSRT